MFVAQPFIVSGASMTPTFEDGDYLIVDEISYHLGEPDRGSVVIFRYPLDPKTFFIKRIIGLPGETVGTKGSEVTIQNKENSNGFILDESYIAFPKNDYTTITLADNEYFVMGDNRAGSSDSRIWGPLKREFIIGRPIIRLLPIGGLSVLPGNINK